MIPNLDNDGYLHDFNEWNREVAVELAALEGIVLTQEHWEIIYSMRSFYNKYELVPSQRPFVKHISNTLGKEKGNSIYLMKLFPESPGKLAARIAGLPKPSNCF